MSTSLIFFYLQMVIETGALIFLFVTAVLVYRRLRRPLFFVQAMGLGLLIGGMAFYWLQQFGAFRHAPQWILQVELWIYTFSLVALALGNWQILRCTKAMSEQKSHIPN